MESNPLVPKSLLFGTYTCPGCCITDLDLHGALCPLSRGGVSLLDVEIAVCWGRQDEAACAERAQKKRIINS